MGNKRNISSKVVSSLVKILEKEIAVTMPEIYYYFSLYTKEEYELMKTDMNADMKSKMDKLGNNEIPKIIKDWLRDKVRADVRFLEEIWKRETIEQYEEEDLIKLLKVIFYMRKESPDFFYRTEGSEGIANKAINAQVRKGELIYNYEEYGNILLKKWNELYPDEIINITEELYNVAQQDIMLLEHLKSNIIYFWGYNIDYTKEKFKSLLKEIDNVQKKVTKIAEEKDSNMNVCLLYIDVLSGIIRDMLVFVYRMNELEVDKSDTAENVIDKYIKYANNRLKLADVETTAGSYHCMYNYVMHILLLSIIGERQLWKDIVEIITDKQVKTSAENEITIKSIDMDKCSIIADWFKEKYPKEVTWNNTILIQIIYKECFVNKEVPTRIAKRGASSFVNFLRSEKYGKAKNMNKQEMFYFEKILAGIEKENGTWESYRQGKKQLLKLYDFEIGMFKRTDIRRGYLGKWVEIMNESFRKILLEYNLLEI